MDYLTVMTPEGASARRNIDADSLRIGRASGNDLVLKDLNVSRTHAAIVKRPDGLFVLDAGGKNGTFVNDRRIAEPTRLSPGDRVRLGSTLLIFNGATVPNVEFSDRPLLQGAGTTYFSPAGLRTPDLHEIPLILESKTPVPPPVDGVSAASIASIIQEANEQLVFHRPLSEILETIMDLARRAVPFERGLLMLREGEKLQAQVIRVPPDEVGSTISISRTIADRVLRSQESILTSDALIDDRFRQGHSVEAQQLRSVMCVPLWNNREVIGLIYVDNRHRAALFSEESLRLLTYLANVAAVKIENARLFEQVVAKERMEQELQKAREIQDHLLPAHGPPIPGYEVFGHSAPCQAVGGDYFDYLDLPGGCYGIGLGDVAGKGLPAALLMASFQAGLHALCEMGQSPEETITRLNRLLSRRIPQNRFVTFFYGVLDPARHTLTYVNAGQNPPCRVRAGAEVERLTATGPPLGLLPDAVFKPRTLAILPGDIVLCFSDGATEGRSATDEEFGEARLIEIVRQDPSAGPEDIVHRAAAAVETHCAASPRQDDITLVVLKRSA
jgi:serine phosphatase RsbU (regulator of sigma subunit)/pSer/pThr/pTyr-binding forkhead associated (FHA) protein